MPINLNDLQKAASQPVKVYSPKFFDAKLTGRGGATPGRLSGRNNPVNIDPSVKTATFAYETVRKTTKSGPTTVNRIPVSPLHHTMWEVLSEVERPELNDMTLIGETITGKAPEGKLYMKMEPNTIIIEDTTVTDPKTQATSTHSSFTANYIIKLFLVFDENKKMHNNVGTTSPLPNNSWQKTNAMRVYYSSNPMTEFLSNIVPSDFLGWKIDDKAVIDYMAAYEIYDEVCSKSKEWQEDIDKTLDTAFANLAKNPRQTNASVYAYVARQLKYIMSYNIPLDLYKNIYASIVKHFPADKVKDICKQNLNLLLSDTINGLNTDKTNIPCASMKPGTTLPANIQKLSAEQKKAVTSNEPLILVQSGAGCGKSTLILARIEHLINIGVKPEDITVLSFTNAAADHITEKNPNVNSMTIARMIHEIYTVNHSNHELSSLDTIANSLEIYYPFSPATANSVPQTFQKRILALMKNEPNSFTEMNNFIEDNYDAVINILDTIHQTSLELEIMICYQKIDTFIEPASVTSKYLIIDEVQDNSIFEFVYTLKYVSKHKEALFIVGDSSQTLYEFRASNPRALNILENSGCFATYQLTTNYRSNQEILDFANVALQNIEANRYAQIQLRANSLVKVTEQSFLDRVWFNYHLCTKSIAKFREELPSIFSIEVRPYIEQCLAKGEKVTVLAYTRKDIAAIKQIFEAQYPDKSVVSLVPEKMYNTTIMSTFIKKYWNQLKFAPMTDMVKIIRSNILSKLQYITWDAQKALPRIQKMLDEWVITQSPAITTWINQMQAGQITKEKLLELVKDNMIKFEISQNAIKQSLLTARNQEMKSNGAAENADFILSTIHSAKGLEFDNVIILYRNENSMSEDNKRMYYVALTRAMKSEYILAYDTMKSPQIQADYVTVLRNLHSIAPAVNSPIDRLDNKKRKGKVTL